MTAAHSAQRNPQPHETIGDGMTHEEAMQMHYQMGNSPAEERGDQGQSGNMAAMGMGREGDMERSASGVLDPEEVSMQQIFDQA